jgi:hypothetical protein
MSLDEVLMQGALMNRTYILPKDVHGEELYRRISLLIKKNRWAWPAVGAIFGLIGGMLSIIMGALLWAIVARLALSGGHASFLNVLETVSFVLSLPLLVFGAYCLDLLEKRTPVIPLLPVQSQLTVFGSRHRFRARRPNQN